MPNWVFGYLTVTARTRKPRKGNLADAGLVPDEHGRVSDLATFMEAVKTPACLEVAPFSDEPLPFDFEQIIPTPCALYAAEKVYYSDPVEKAKQEAEEARLTKLYGYGSAYDFHVGEWDTKWNASECYISKDGDKDVSVTKTTHQVVYTFQTAWSPPIKVIKRVSEMFPRLAFVYHCEEEAEMFLPFTARFKAGVETSFKEHPSQHTEDDGDE